MRRLFLTVLVGLVGLLVHGHASLPASGAEAVVVPLSFVIQRPAGPPFLLRLMVLATSADTAAVIGRETVRSVAPGARIAETGGDEASAQYTPWSWRWDDAELPVVVSYNPTGAVAGFGPQAVISALAAWSGVPGSKFAFRYGGITDHGASLGDDSPDGENVIEWRVLPCTPAACALGLTSKEVTHEADLILNSNPAARLGDGLAGAPVDAGSVALHEAGHIAGLEHSCPPLVGPCSTEELNAVMYFQYVGVHRALGADDRAGIVALYPGVAALPAWQLVLEQGWNLTVLPGARISATMSALTCARAVYGWRDGGWLVWIRGLPEALQSVETIESGAAYWLFADAACAMDLR